MEVAGCCLYLLCGVERQAQDKNISDNPTACGAKAGSDTHKVILSVCSLQGAQSAITLGRFPILCNGLIRLCVCIKDLHYDLLGGGSHFLFSSMFTVL